MQREAKKCKHIASFFNSRSNAKPDEEYSGSESRATDKKRAVSEYVNTEDQQRSSITSAAPLNDLGIDHPFQPVLQAFPFAKFGEKNGSFNKS